MSNNLNALVTKIKDSLNNLVTLEIITAVGQVRLKPKSGSSQDPERSFPDLDYDKNPKVILTKIDLLQGDIKTVFHEEFVTGNYQSLKDFHADREKEGYEIVHKNLAALKELLEMVQDWLGG